MDILKELNDKQQEAVKITNGPLLILAGAGTGKTKTITYRIAHMIKEHKIKPSNILAVTFTKKAANEMKERIETLIGNKSNSLTVCTFHSLGVKILRKYGYLLGYTKNFNIYDDNDSKQVIKKIITDDSNNFEVSKEDMYTLYNCIEIYKRTQKIPKVLYHTDILEISFLKIVKEYNDTLKRNNAFDFIDLLIKPHELLSTNIEVLEELQEKYKYITIDEYQDTDDIQYEIVTMLADKYKNICVVGDEDQSIYSFRGANIENILNFKNDYTNCTEIKLEQNYRSTKNILNSANSVIKNNETSFHKNLWTNNIEGEKLKIVNALTDKTEAELIVDDIKNKIKNGIKLKDIAILYRINSLSKNFEDLFLKNNIPYKIWGDYQFFQRKEIRNTLAHLQLINNPNDDFICEMVISLLKGIGNVTINKIKKFASKKKISLYKCISKIDDMGKELSTLNKEKLFRISKVIDNIRKNQEKLKITDMLQKMFITTQYVQNISDSDGRKQERIENINQLILGILNFEKEKPNITIDEYLEEIIMMSEVNDDLENKDFINLLTVHKAKGLEYDYVYLVGMNEKTFPFFKAVEEDNLEEERRLCYVAITRAKKELWISYADEKYIFSKQFKQFIPTDLYPSMFLREIPEYLVNFSYKIGFDNDDSGHFDSIKNNDNFNNDNKETKLILDVNDDLETPTLNDELTLF